ncbi:MAG: hypothetical protein QOI24_2552 [Acidobacteriota bacterium]|jgi:hypothetical protein|nr:hypothetical protein [Acidobacteriota bacterium]
MPNPVVYAGYVGNRVRLWIICESCRRQVFLGSMITSGPTFTPPLCSWCHPVAKPRTESEEDEISRSA